MPITLGSNIAALSSQRRLNEASNAAASSYERLSSGQRINRASDDAAGLAIASSLRADSRIYGQGIKNLNDGISLLNIAEGALNELSGIVTRISELAEQAANGAYSSAQRSVINSETQALSSEYQRITQSTKFNGLNLLDGSVSDLVLQGGHSSLLLNLGAAGSGSYAAGNGTLTAQGSGLAAGNLPNGVIIADLNGDGYGDIASINAVSTTLDIFIGNGDGTFKARQVYTSGTNVTGLVAADFNGDGILDIAASAKTTGNVDVFIGNSDGSFKNHVNYGTGGDGIAAADLNGDGIQDLVTSLRTTGATYVMLGNGNGTFRAAVSFVSISNSRDAVIADLNGDGKLDIFFGSGSTNSYGVLFGNGNGTFNSVSVGTITGLTQSSYTNARDLNGDGYADIVVGSSADTGVWVMMNQGNGTFAAAKSYGTAGRTYVDVKTADFNGDGIYDIIGSTHSGNAIDLLIGNGDGTFKAAASFAAGTYADTIGVGDLNHDGVSDVALDNIQASGLVVPFITGTVQSASAGTIAATIALGTVSTVTIEAARTALTNMASVRQNLGAGLALIGAYQSRIDAFTRVLHAGSLNAQTAESRIMDADIAQESALLVRNQIRQQAAASILTHANRGPELALSLLKGN